MSGIEDLVRKFDDFENSMKTVLPKVDTRLIIDMLHRIKRDESPMYTIEIFLDKRPDEEKIRSIITEGLGVMPAFYDQGTHIVVAHRFNLQMLEYITKNMDVAKIRGTFTGAGRGASIGPVFERDDATDY
ncbi:hypothetical protein [Candidatus Nitrosocosmicus franklandus]|uniref:Uncharacterized protein n=1 Tax=Candidatus Nitrosocosmicus franklandianus TaxID=1798806 RepID=A0A484I6T9_9ARCH|nr:hypothetical protein [Candidatus Nitrosocosmicus franklandus]VFJ12825.1 conserved protein of unknown function [Candidatus Nitrosocosmicus franklandus]